MKTKFEDFLNEYRTPLGYGDNDYDSGNTLLDSSTSFTIVDIGGDNTSEITDSGVDMTNLSYVKYFINNTSCMNGAIPTEWK